MLAIRAVRPLLLAAALAPCASLAQTHDGAALTTLLAGMSNDERTFFGHVTTLSNPFFEGRVPGSDGNRFAAAYIEFHLRQAGIEPIFPETITAADGSTVETPRASFRQTFSAGTSVEVARAVIGVRRPGASERAIPLGEQASVLGFSGSGTVAAPLAFAGYSLPEETRGYRSYADADRLDGRIAIVLRYEPMTESGTSRFSDGEGWSPEAALYPKVKAAVDRGAAGVIFVNPPGASDPRAAELLTTDGSRRYGAVLGVPVIMLATDAADALVREADPAGRSLLELRRIADQQGGIIELAGATAVLDVAVTRTSIDTDNVAGVLPGRGPLAGEYVVVGAHYDHLGYGGFGSRTGAGPLHPGADDNASGTAGVLLAAERLARRYRELPEGASARSIIFVGFSAEESGLIGSRHMVANLPVPRESVTLMLNMDMIGRLREGSLELGGVGTAEGFEPWLQPYVQSSGLAVKGSSVGDDRSDHASFVRAGIPALFFFTGLHEDYHQPTDFWWRVNVAGGVRIVDLVTELTAAVATRAEPLRFIERTAPDANAAAASMPRLRVRFGIAPDNYGDDKPGIVVAQVYPGTTAADAGLQKGDRLMRWNGEEIASVEGWMQLMGGARPGDKVELVYLRDGQEQTVTATLKGREPTQR